MTRDEHKIKDPVVVHIILSLMKNMEGNRINEIVIKFLDKIDFGDDIEQSLNFYAEMRASFGHIEKVTVSLVIYPLI